MKTKYSESPTNKVLNLAANDDADACMELALRFQTGTVMLEKNINKSNYWKKRAEDLGYNNPPTSNSSNYKLLPNSALMALASIRDVDACLELATRFSDDNDKAGFWNDKALEYQRKNNNYPETQLCPKAEIKEKKYDWAVTPDKNKHEYVIGIDFGHGETSAAYCEIGWDTSNGELKNVKDIEVGDNSKVMPSAICITNDNKAYIGKSAFDDDLLKNAQIHVCFKKRPENINGEKEQLMIRFMHEVYLKIRERSGAFLTDDNHIVYIAMPSGWTQTDKNLYGQMAAQAGIPIADITLESRAAFIKAQQDTSSGLPRYIDKGAVVFDMGSSTLDFTYIYVNNGQNKTFDYGYDCGASQIEKSMYADVCKKNPKIIDFEKKYPNLIDYLLFKAREAKEQNYYNPNKPCKPHATFFSEIVDDEEFEDTKMKFIFQPGELNQMLKDKGYIDKIRKAMIDFRDNHISGRRIEVAFLTGGASRMDFITDLIEDCWHLPLDLIYKDQDPSLTISQGIAVLGRIDSRSGGMGAVQQVLSKINTQWDIYTPFTNSLIEKVTNEITSTIDACFVDFCNSDEDLSINDLQSNINRNIKTNVIQIGNWAMDCYKEAFRKKTEDIRSDLDKIASSYSNAKIQMRETKVNFNSMPQIDLSVLTQQMQEISSTFIEDSSNLIQGIAGAAIGGAVAMLLGGPLAWLIGGGYLIGKFFFGEEKTEEQKREEALAKKLNTDARIKIYSEFDMDSISAKVRNSVTQSINSNYKLRQTINEQSKKTITEYANECIAQTRLMVE